MVSGAAFIPMVLPSVSAGDLNTPPTAQHGDRMVEDSDGDGTVTLQFLDTESEDPDHVHDSGNDLACELAGTTSTGGDNGIQDWLWMNATNETEDSLMTAENYLHDENPTKDLTFGLGVYQIALRVEDICGARDWVNFTLEVRPTVTTVEETTSSTDDNWTLTGLWQTTDACEAANDALEADPPYLAFTEVASDGTCSYDTGTSPSGSATLSINVTENNSWYRFGVRFDHFWDTGTSELDDQDRMTFQASFDGGDTWVGVNATTSGCGTDANDQGRNCWDDDSEEPVSWTTYATVFDVRDYNVTEAEILLRWTFDTGGLEDNDNPGWFIDNIGFFGLKEAPPSGEYAEPGSGEVTVYQYDNTVQSLTPIGTTEDKAGYFCVDAYDKWEEPNKTCAAADDTCQHGVFCVTITMAAANPTEDETNYMVSVEWGKNCDRPVLDENLRGLAYYQEDPTWSVRACEEIGDRQATAILAVDGQTMDEDQLSY
jgi:hypothetical protein